MKNGARTDVAQAVTATRVEVVGGPRVRERMWTAAVGLGAMMLWGAAGAHRSPAQGPDSFRYQSSPDADYQNGNLAPLDGRNEAQQQAEQYGYQQGAPGAQYGYGADANGYYDGERDATDEAEAVYEADLTEDAATEPPPPLPYYEQPEAPYPDYIWTPGYWAWAPMGYYWVPGAWVEPPYVGALWTPGYWAFYDGRYRFHHGYWGLHIGFYGGINYGYGYTGYGYYGGYWRDNHFFYNRVVNRIDLRTINRVYDYRFREANFAGRPSFNGPRGITVRPRPAEMVVLRERRFAPLPSQLQLRQQSMQNRQQFFTANHGRPAVVAEARPVVSNHQVPAQLPVWQGRRGWQGQQGQSQNAGEGRVTPLQGSWQGRIQQGQQPNTNGRIQQQGQQPQVQNQPWQAVNPNGWQGRIQQQGQQGQVQAQPQPAQPQPSQPQPQGNSGAWQGRQPQPGQAVNPNGWQGRIQQQGQQPQIQAQPQPGQPMGWQGRIQQQGQQPQVQAQPQPGAPAPSGGWQGRIQQQGQQPQIQAQPQPGQPTNPNAWQGRQPGAWQSRQQQIQPAQPVNPVYPGWQGRIQQQGQPQPVPQQPNQQQFRRMEAGPAPSQPQAPPQPAAPPQPQFRRGPEGVRMSSPPAGAQPAPQPHLGAGGRWGRDR